MAKFCDIKQILKHVRAIPAGQGSPLKNGKIEEIQTFVDRGGNINAVVKNTTILCELVRKGQVEASAWLISVGANVNLCDVCGCSPLYIAASHGNFKMVELLLDLGAHTEGVFGNTNRIHENTSMQTIKAGYTPLVSAIQNNYKECARLLIRRGANVNVTWQNSYGANLNLFTQVLFGKHDTDLALTLLHAGVRPYPLMKPLVYMLIGDSNVTLKFIRTMIAVGFTLPIDGYRELCKLGQLDSTPEQEEVMTYLEEVQQRPLTLYELCRQAVRHALGCNPLRCHISEKILQLQLPVNVRKFLELDQDYL